MAGQSTAWVSTARMLRRAGFGATGPEVDAAVGRDWPGYVDVMLAGDPGADPGAVATPMPAFAAPKPPGKGATPAAHQQYNRQSWVAYSEFGRRVRANASQGTDHGTAGPVFIAGAPVRGGFYGEQPSLTDLDNGDLKYSTDFRDIYAELLARTVGADPTPSVGTGRNTLGLLSAQHAHAVPGDGELFVRRDHQHGDR